MFDAKTQARLWGKVDRRGADECWPWIGTGSKGYGLMYVAGKTLKAHRLAYCLGHGVDMPPSAVVIRHKCDNRGCCNPAHLEPGSAQDNIQDMIDRRRHWAHKIDTCAAGHPLDGKQMGGFRRCSECQRAANRAYYQRAKAAGKLSWEARKAGQTTRWRNLAGAIA